MTAQSKVRWAQLILDSIKSVINKMENEALSAVTNQQGLEETLYPYFNAEIVRHCNLNHIPIVGIGSGRISKEALARIDCIVLTKAGEKVGIELKGPSQSAYLLAGASGAYNEKDNNIKECLEKLYNDNGANTKVHPDSHIADTLKLIRLIDQEKPELTCGYSVGILKYTKTSSEEAKKYLDKLIIMLDCFKGITAVSCNLSVNDVKRKNCFITIVEILPVKRDGGNKWKIGV